jgi:DNA (cytosine-5)-methyltransferase 1
VYITATRIPDAVASDPELDIEPDPIRFPEPYAKEQWHLEDLLDDSHNIPGSDLTDSERLWIDAWDDFIQRWYEATAGRRPPGFPIWADTWNGSTLIDRHRIGRLFGPSPDYRELMEFDPTLPKWKAGHLAKNLDLYATHREWIDEWAKKWGVFTDAFPPSRRKLEWQAQDTLRLWETVMHMRPSGIRAKAVTYLPALVAITQTSIVGPRERRLSPRETARLQGLPDSFGFGDQKPAATYKQMGNGVNVGVVWNVLREHVRRDEWLLKHSEAGRRIIAAVLDAPASPDKILAKHQPAER